MGRNVFVWRGVVLAAAVMLAAGGSVAGGGGVVRGAEEAAGAGTERAAKAEWGKISNEIKSQDDLKTIVGMHDRFLNAYADSSLAQSVSNSRDVYAALLQADAKKFHGKWVPAEQIEVMEKTWRDEVQPALSLYEAGKYKEATEAARQVERSDKDNATAWAIDGDSAYHLKLPAAARGTFEKLAAVDPENVLAHNNLAVLAFENKQMVVGMMHYTKALGQGSESVVLLNNVAEALHTYLTSGGAGGAAGDKNNATYKELASKVVGAEGRMVATMAKQGLVRRGSMWVTQAQEDKITQDVSAIKYQMAMLDKQFADLQQQAAAAQRGLAEAQAASQKTLNTLVSMDARAGSRGQMGGFLDRDRMEKELSQSAGRQGEYKETLARLSQALPDFKKAAETLKGQMAAADQKYTGVQRMMEPENSRPAAELMASATTVTLPSAATGQAMVADAAPGAVQVGAQRGVQAGAVTRPAANQIAVENRIDGGPEDDGVPLAANPEPVPSSGVPPLVLPPMPYVPTLLYPAGGMMPLYKVGHSGPAEPSNLPIPMGSDYTIPRMVTYPMLPVLPGTYPVAPGGGGAPYFPGQRSYFPSQPVPQQWQLPGDKQPPMDMLPQFDPGYVLGPMLLRNGSMVPASGPMTPGGGSMTPSGGSMTPNGGSMTPSGGSMTPSGRSMTPSGGSMTPQGGASMTPKAAK
jgi:tetratricopeptide (TPR) repeat protein